MQKEHITTLIHKLKLFLVETKLRYERGYGYVKYIQYILTILATLKILNINLYLTIPIIILGYAVGYIDQKKGIWLIESEYGTTALNPYFKRLEDKLNKIQKKQNLYH